MKRRTARKIVKALLQGESRWRHDTAAKAERIADSEPCREFYRFIKNMLPSWANYTEGVVTQEPCTTERIRAAKVYPPWDTAVSKCFRVTRPGA